MVPITQYRQVKHGAQVSVDFTGVENVSKKSNNLFLYGALGVGAWWLYHKHCQAKAQATAAAVASPINQHALANAAMMQPGGVVQPLTNQPPAGMS